MSTVPIEEAQAHLVELIGTLSPGKEIVITRNNQPVAQLTGLPAELPRPVPGRCQGKLTVVSEDDDHLQDWTEYMP
ncbi:MAG: hypothetical protein K8T91_06115 [Planctomycetes bacterium]|nr:hypothetical protein [Planctomycetota bacterium]